MTRVGETAASEELIIDPEPLLAGVLDDLTAGVDPEAIALEAHIAIADALCDAAERIAAREGVQTIALSGGVFMNRLILEETQGHLEANGLRVLVPERVPLNDGGIAYGQAAIARAQYSDGLPSA